VSNPLVLLHGYSASGQAFYYDGTKPGKPALFYPFTTTLLEIVLNREPVPPVNILQWLP
jgi:hypothetical protein